MKSDNDKKDLVCHRWILFAYKQNSAISTIAIDKSQQECFYKADGTYQEVIHEHQLDLKITGNWFFNSDQTKLGRVMSTMNGLTLPTDQDSTKRTDYVILKLTNDTLIYEHEMVSNYKFDWYFVRKD